MQLLRLRPAFEGTDATFVTVSDAYRSDLGDDIAGFRVVTDATQWERLRMLQLFAQLLWIVVRVRPRVVVTTGAAPGVLALACGRLIGARTMWIDSIANVEVLSGSGRLASRFAHRCLTQWPELATDDVEHHGAVL